MHSEIREFWRLRKLQPRRQQFCGSLRSKSGLELELLIPRRNFSKGAVWVLGKIEVLFSILCQAWHIRCS